MASSILNNHSESKVSSPGDLPLLLQKPRKWTYKHLEVARVKLSENVTTEELLGQDYVPVDGDPEFETFAKIFCAPTRKQLESGDVRSFYHLHNGGLSSTFNRLWNISLYDIESVVNSGTLRSVLDDVIGQIILRTKARKRLHLLWEGTIPFEIPQLKFRGQTYADGTLMGYNKDDGGFNIPLAFLSIVKESGDDGIAKYQVPQTLFPAIISYSRNPKLSEYHGHAICYDGVYMYVCKAIVSSAYMEALCKHGSVTEDLRFYRSEPFEVLEPAGRRGFIRLIVTLFRYLSQD
ncbi:hypothetical protein ASPWEDRAFT_174740 [Aspergillus wentii DTO 134E9]|uniref:Uncharacterized protein n=1 Tax=Aspergillus wentii DTO 134E9 TaxID=1073089 RepID=A0A1L9REI4_ASPWE|nr:uncharacterized protein ASPWEDRAFT_174740 [Aspergillus wentii DTO 134E9]OJJ33331.1 hypothetical protein ASPWEDRAFT_174740 [Aspergillus wentii DTO 134E9]